MRCLVMKKFFGLILLGYMFINGVVSAASPDDIKVSDAIRFARNEVPRSCRLQSIDKYSDAYGIAFRDFNDFRNYVVYIDKTNGRPLARNMNSTNIVGSTTINVSAEQVTKSAFARYKNIQGVDIKLEPEGKNNVRYHVMAYSSLYAIDAYYSPSTGVLGKEIIVYK